MKFGKYIQSHLVPGWSQHYLDYKFLKKIISSLSANKPASEAASLALGVRPVDFSANPRSIASVDDVSPDRPPIFPELGSDGSRGLDFQAHKAAFFFKLERELEKINVFYLQKEAELKLRLETLLSKRRAAATHGSSDPSTEDMTHAEWSAVEEGFRLLERDLNKLQQFVEINATGFRKILKKFDKRSTSSTKELYLARQVEVQPVFNRQLISDLSDTVAACLVDLTDLSSGLRFEGQPTDDIFTQQIISEHALHTGPFHDLEKNLRKAIANSDAAAMTDCVRTSEMLAQQQQLTGGSGNISRILWNAILEAPVDLADLVLGSLSSPFDFQYVDDINGRTCLHEAAIAGEVRLVDLCINEKVQVDKPDQYDRTALHYAAMNGHAFVCQRLLDKSCPLNVLDKDNYSPLVYATLRGHVGCVKVLLDQPDIELQASGDTSPLSLASQGGHAQVVSLLLQRGARCRPNSNGEYPMHLAAREGHHEVCKLLIHSEGWDLPDKYHEWTPVFHSSRYGHLECLRVILAVGSRSQVRDELGHLPIHYAAWYGHIDCVDLLLSVSPNRSATLSVDPVARITDDSPLSDEELSQNSEIDLIPPISLPPPIMPHRVYGHNYLDRTNLVQVRIGGALDRERARNSSGVKLYHRLISSAFKDEYFLAATPLKLVMTTGRSTNSAPYTIPLPQRDEPGYFAFQILSSEPLSLHFSLYPNFGTKTIGRAVALPSLFSGRGRRSYMLPILDTRLHIIGEVAFEVNIITPFEGVTLEVAGNLETYWKSIRNQATPATGDISWPPRRNIAGSATTSPAIHSVTSAVEKTLTISSLQGKFLRVPVQLTRDLQPVVYSGRYLPDTLLDIPVHSVTLLQFETLAHNLDLTWEPSQARTFHSVEDLSTAMVSLSTLLQALPADIPLILDLECHFVSPSAVAPPTHGGGISVNQFADTILATVHAGSNTRQSPTQPPRRLAFSSMWPEVCSAVNWKQPNYPVFFVAGCRPSSEWTDPRSTSLGAALEFARADNLLGIFIDADLFLRVPSLTQGVRNLGFLVGVNDGPEAGSIEHTSIDVLCQKNIVTFIEHALT